MSMIARIKAGIDSSGILSPLSVIAAVAVLTYASTVCLLIFFNVFLRAKTELSGNLGDDV
jgi:hypothetical protein